jgi:hypothetical protein
MSCFGDSFYAIQFILACIPYTLVGMLMNVFVVFIEWCVMVYKLISLFLAIASTELFMLLYSHWIANSVVLHRCFRTSNYDESSSHDVLSAVSAAIE